MPAGTPLNPRDNLTLEEYNIKNGSTLNFLLRLPGGSNVGETFDVLDKTLENYDLCDLPGLVTVTYECDEIALDDDPNVKRAKMLCGHVM